MSKNLPFTGQVEQYSLADARLLDRICSTVPAMLYEYVIDDGGISRCLFCSEHSRTLLGVEPDALCADIHLFWSLIHPDDREAFLCADREANKAGRPFFGEYRVRLSDGQEKWLRIASRPAKPDPGRAPTWLGYMIDVSESRRLEDELQERVSHDYLTGLLTRQSLQDRFEFQQRRMQRYGGLCSVMMLDLDHFKSINDRFGHAAGDEVLKEFTRRVSAELRELDYFARWGGEEFCVLLPESNVDSAHAVALRIVAAVNAEPFRENPRVMPVTVSVGVTALKDPLECLEDALQRADAALYRAKQDGRNRVERG